MGADLLKSAPVWAMHVHKLLCRQGLMNRSNFACITTPIDFSWATAMNKSLQDSRCNSSILGVKAKAQ